MFKWYVNLIFVDMYMIGFIIQSQISSSTQDIHSKYLVKEMIYLKYRYLKRVDSLKLLILSHEHRMETRIWEENYLCLSPKRNRIYSSRSI